MYSSVSGLWLNRMTIQRAGDGVYCERLVLLYSSCLMRAVCRLAHRCLEWFSLLHSAPGAPCVGGIDRPWIGLQRAWLLMSVCAGTRGNAGDPRAELRLARSGGMSRREGCIRSPGITFITLSYTEREHNMPTHTVRLKWPTHVYCKHNRVFDPIAASSQCLWLTLNKECGSLLVYKRAYAHHTSKLQLYCCNLIVTTKCCYTVFFL